MPIPTDTFWNIKRLNIVFALAAVSLLGVTFWAILQDHDRQWRTVQRHARVWEAALVNQRISRVLTEQQQKELASLQEQIAAKQADLTSSNRRFSELSEEKKKLESERATLQFKLNNLKSNVQVMQANLQDAIAASNNALAAKLQAELQQPQKQLADWTEQMAWLDQRLASIRAEMDAQTAQLDDLKRQRTQLAGELETLQKRLQTLEPKSPLARFSESIRNAPLLDFINPSQRVQQVVLPDVLTDVAFMKIPTIDRCTTCHVNIAKKEYTPENIVAYLEEQVATSRRLDLPLQASGRPADPSATANNPGPVAAVEFWHNWARALAPDLIRKNAARIGLIARTVGDGKPASVTYDGQILAEFRYDPASADDRQNEILLALLEGYYRWNKSTDAKASRGKATVVISSTVEERAIAPARNAAMRYAEELRNGLKASLDQQTYRLLEDRYRYTLTEEVNLARRKLGLSPLDPSPALLAHPRLDLYVDTESPHSFEAVGCTSCHDGSGQETDFVLAAHVPRDIYVDAFTGAPVLPRQEKPGPYLDPVTGKTSQAITQFEYWKRKFEPKAPRSFELVYHEWDWPMRTPQFIQANCARCHTEVYDIKQAAPALYQGRQLFTQLGCVNCHQMDSIPPEQNRKVGPDLRHVTEKLSPQFINTWIWSPGAFRPTTKMPHFFMLENNSSPQDIRRTRQEARAITEYLVRTATPLPPKYPYPPGGHGSAEAGKMIFNTVGCLACHQNLNETAQQWITTDLVKRAGMKPEEAQAAYAAMGYYERHRYVQEHFSAPPTQTTLPKYSDGSPKPVFVQVGPELSAIGTKLLAGRTPQQARQWLFDWLKEPQHYSQYTFMPNLRLSDQQAMDLVEYLLDQKRTILDPNDQWTAGLAEIDTETLKELTALQLQSRYSPQTARIKADDEQELTSLATTALSGATGSADQASAQVAAMSPDEKRLVFLGQKLIAHYGCMSCHAINGMETVSSPCTNLSDWGQKGVDKLDFGYLDPHKVQSLPTTASINVIDGTSAQAANLAHQNLAGENTGRVAEVPWPRLQNTRQSWLTQKLKNPRIYDRGRTLLDEKPYEKLKMPLFNLTDQQIQDIVTFVISNRDRLISDRLTLKATSEQAKTIARGRELVERLNCVGCHQIEQNTPQIQQHFQADQIITRAPPSLRGEGNKIQHSWLFNFFKDVQPLRPLLADGIRMPSFSASDQEWTSIIAYFNAVSNKESRQLAKWIDPIVKSISAKPDPDWWQRREFAAAADYLKNWGLAHGHIRPIEVGPLATPDDLRKVYAALLFKARFTQRLYNSPYPFVDSPRQQISDERFRLGEKFFYEMQCLKCHVLGDPDAPGANRNPTAPNLTLAYERLQRRWIRHWIQEPNIIQVGTAMPPFFTGLSIGSLQGQSWPASQGAPADQVLRIESTYGKTVEEQTELLLDFLYAAGAKGFTGVQPATAAPTTQAAQADLEHVHLHRTE